MNSLIKEQLAKLNIPTVTIDGKVYKISEIPEDATVLVFTNKVSEDGELIKGALYHFVFEKYIVKTPPGFDLHNKWNKGVVTPFTYMYGEVTDKLGKMYYLKCYGSDLKSTSCHHCLRMLNWGVLCDSCKQKYGIINEEDIKKITWEGWVPKKSIIFAEEV